MRTREEQIAELVDALKKPVCRPDYSVSILEDWLKHHILEAEVRGIAAIKSSAKTAQEDERPDIRKWQEDQKEWFDPTIREIVAEYAAWRDQQDHSQALKQESHSNEAEQRVRAEIGRDSERLDWLLAHSHYGIPGFDPVVSGRTSEKRRADLIRAIDAAREVG